MTLSILQERLPGQNCEACPHHALCHDVRLDADGRVVNMLVCRIERNIQRNASAREFLRRVQPKLKKYIRGLPDKDEALADLQSALVENLLTRYRMGMPAHPLLWLFNGRNSAAGRWRHNRVRQIRRMRQRHLFTSDFNVDALTALNWQASWHWVASGPLKPAEYPLEYDDRVFERQRAAAILALVDDGQTLDTSEYRVLAFCLRHHSGRGPLLNGVHKRLATLMDVDLATVGRLYRSALRKVLDATGNAPQLLRQYGVYVPPRPRDATLTENDYATIRAAVHAPVAALALYYRVTDYTIRRVRQRATDAGVSELR